VDDQVAAAPHRHPYGLDHARPWWWRRWTVPSRDTVRDVAQLGAETTRLAAHLWLPPWRWEWWWYPPFHEWRTQVGARVTAGIRTQRTRFVWWARGWAQLPAWLAAGWARRVTRWQPRRWPQRAQWTRQRWQGAARRRRAQWTRQRWQQRWQGAARRAARRQWPGWLARRWPRAQWAGRIEQWAWREPRPARWPVRRRRPEWTWHGCRTRGRAEWTWLRRRWAQRTRRAVRWPDGTRFDPGHDDVGPSGLGLRCPRCGRSGARIVRQVGTVRQAVRRDRPGMGERPGFPPGRWAGHPHPQHPTHERWIPGHERPGTGHERSGTDIAGTRWERWRPDPGYWDEWAEHPVGTPAPWQRAAQLGWTERDEERRESLVAAVGPCRRCTRAGQFDIARIAWRTRRRRDALGYTVGAWAWTVREAARRDRRRARLGVEPGQPPGRRAGQPDPGDAARHQYRDGTHRNGDG
jgi:hypothetical protein